MCRLSGRSTKKIICIQYDFLGTPATLYCVIRVVGFASLLRVKKTAIPQSRNANLRLKPSSSR